MTHPQPDEAQVESELTVDIDAWIEAESRAGEGIPDFWDELNTSERLAKHLQKLGYVKIVEIGP